MSDVFWLSIHGLEVELPSKRQLTHESPFPVPFFIPGNLGFAKTTTRYYTLCMKNVLKQGNSYSNVIIMTDNIKLL